MLEGVAVKLAVGVAVTLAVGVAAPVAVGVGVLPGAVLDAVGVAVKVEVAVAVGVADRVAVAVAVGELLPPENNPYTASGTWLRRKPFATVGTVNFTARPGWSVLNLLLS